MITVRQRRIGPIAALLIGCAACFNPEGDGSGSTTTATTTTTTTTTTTSGSTGQGASTSEPSTPTTSLPGTADATSESPSDPSASTSTTVDPQTTSDTDEGTTGPDPLCGNSVVDPKEDCDPGLLVTVVGCEDCKRSGRFVFVTDELRTAAEIGIGEGEALCNAAGPQFDNFKPLTYTVWLSEANNSAPTRLTGLDLPFIGLDGTVIADDQDAFIKGPHLARINRTPSGMVLAIDAIDCVDPLAVVWTGTYASGEWATETCTNWSVIDPMIVGAAGLVSQLDTRWTQACTPACDTSARLYCVENIAG